MKKAKEQDPLVLLSALCNSVRSWRWIQKSLGVRGWRGRVSGIECQSPRDLVGGVGGVGVPFQFMDLHISSGNSAPGSPLVLGPRLSRQSPSLEEGSSG